MWIVKFGGSLMENCDLESLVHELVDHGAGKVVLVPGGGIFADQVRYLQNELKFDDLTSHRMCLRAMELYGTLLASMDPRLHAASNPETIKDLLKDNQVPIWFPYEMTVNNPAIEATWRVTSDSLSLWLAKTMQCQNLILLKSTLPEDGDFSANHLSRFGLIDTAFVEMMTDMFVKPWWLFYGQIHSFFNVLDHADGVASGMKEITVTRD